MTRIATAPDPLFAFRGTVTPRRVPLLYHLGLFVVAAAMVMLPVIYIGFIAVVAQAVFWHITHNWRMVLAMRDVYPFVLVAVLYAGIAGAGITLIFFMIKPLFSGPADAHKPMTLPAETHQLLFEFIRKVCDAVGAPYPSEVQVNCAVNASAGFRRGASSLVANDLVLVIGLPLVAGITMRQFAGILAHEFGHFSQGAGMRLTYVIRGINGWFARVVYERDEWDARLHQLGYEQGWQIQLCVAMAKGAVWLGRSVLWVLMYLGRSISCFMSRQMEFDADACEAQVAGSDEFPRTASRMVMLNAAHRIAMDDAFQTYQRGEVPEDIPWLIQWRESELPKNLRDKLTKYSETVTTGWLDTHPSDLERNRAALALGAPGIFHLEAPARELFADFPALCKTATRAYYEEISLETVKLRFATQDRIIKDREGADQAETSLREFYYELFDMARTLPLPEAATADHWRSACRTMTGEEPAYRALLARFAKAMTTIARQRKGADLLAANFALEAPEDFELKSSCSPADAVRLVAEHGRLLGAATAGMERFETAAAWRLASALAWLSAQPEAQEAAAHRARLITAQRALADVVTMVLQLRRDGESMELVLGSLGNHPAPGEALRHARTIVDRINMSAQRCLVLLGESPHPYAEGAPSITSILRMPTDIENEYDEAFQKAAACTGGLIPLILRVQGELCGQALAAEKTMQHAGLGHVPIPQAAPAPAAVPAAPSFPPLPPSDLPPPTLG